MEVDLDRPGERVALLAHVLVHHPASSLDSVLPYGDSRSKSVSDSSTVKSLGTSVRSRDRICAELSISR